MADGVNDAKFDFDSQMAVQHYFHCDSGRSV
jgi:hypothetical protein